MPYACREDQLAYQQAWRQRRRERYTAGMVCTHCGTAENLNMHHVDPASKVSHKFWSWSIPRLEAELAKCIPLCNACHTRHHLEKPIPHGTHTGYATKGCRCDECRAGHARYQAERRARLHVAA